MLIPLGMIFFGQLPFFYSRSLALDSGFGPDPVFGEILQQEGLGDILAIRTHLGVAGFPRLMVSPGPNPYYPLQFPAPEVGRKELSFLVALPK